MPVTQLGTFSDKSMNIALHRFLHNHDNITTEGSPKQKVRLYPSSPTLIQGSTLTQGSAHGERRWAAAHSTLIRRLTQQLEETWKTEYFEYKNMHGCTIKMAVLMPRPPTTGQCLARSPEPC